MPDFWQFPTGSMGIGPINAIYQARFMRYLQHRGCSRRRTGRAAPRLGRLRRRRDGRARIDRRALARRAREARQPAPSSSTATCSGSTGRCAATARSSRSSRSLFAGAGWNVIKVLWGSDWDALFARDASHALLRRFAHTVDGKYPDARRRRTAPTTSTHLLRPGPRSCRRSSPHMSRRGHRSR